MNKLNRVLLTVPETAELIASGKVLSLAGDENLLAKLPKGNWIAGTIPYFIGEQGGIETKDQIFVTELDCATASSIGIKSYSVETIKNIALDAPENGFTILILPALTPIHAEYANHARDYEDMFIKPVVGWISGVHLSDLGKITPKVVNGATAQVSPDEAVALHVTLPAEQMAVIHILNLFQQNRDSDVITFAETGFSAKTCLVNGKEVVFADYLAENKIDFALPLVADYNGAQINTSFQAVNTETKVVSFYAPVFTGIEYRQAAAVGDYVHEFEALAKGSHQHKQFSCNCILNYLYGELQGRKTGDLDGPMTFGEIAYQLLNQTIVYLEVQAA
jgi:hypothetical protein